MLALARRPTHHAGCDRFERRHWIDPIGGRHRLPSPVRRRVVLMRPIDQTVPSRREIPEAHEAAHPLAVFETMVREIPDGQVIVLAGPSPQDHGALPHRARKNHPKAVSYSDPASARPPPTSLNRSTSKDIGAFTARLSTTCSQLRQQVDRVPSYQNEEVSAHSDAGCVSTKKKPGRGDRV